MLGTRTIALLLGMLGLCILGWGKGYEQPLDSLHELVMGEGRADHEAGYGYAKEAMKLALESGAEEHIAKGYRIQATAYRNAGEEEAALKADRKALAIHRKLGMQIEEAKDIVNMGVSHVYMDALDSAMHYYFQALAVAEEANDSTVMGSILSNLSGGYGRMGDLDRALTYGMRAKEIFEAQGDLYRLGFVLSTISIVHHDREEWEQSEKYLLQELEIRREMGDTLLTMKLTYELASLRVSQGKDREALALLDPVIDYFSDIEYRSNFINALFVKAIALANLKEYRRSLALMDEIMLQAEASEDVTAIRDLYWHRAETYREIGEYKKAFEQLGLYHEVKDSLVDRDLRVEAEKLEKKYKNAQLQRELEARSSMLTIERYKKEVKQNELNRLYLVLAAGAIFLLLGAFMVWLLIRQMRLKANYARLDLEQKALKAQMNPHFLFNALNSIQSCILHEAKEVAYNYHSKFATLMRMVLMQSEQKVISLQSELETLELYLSLEQLRSSDHFSYDIEVPEGIRPSEVQVPSMLIQPFVENAIWHGMMNNPEPGRLLVRIEEEGTHFRVSVDDNGVGRAAAARIKQGNKVGHPSVGMEVTEQRLRLYNYKRRKKLTFEVVDKFKGDGSAAGTLVNLFIPKTELQ